MNDSITQLQKQTFRYYYQDGLVEMAVGILFALIGLDTWLISSAPQGTLLAVSAWVLLPILTIGGIIGVQRFVKNLKEKLVHPRTGYIQYAAKPNHYRWVVSGAAFAIAIAILLLPHSWLASESVTAGTILFIILASIGAQANLKRLIIIACLGLVLGIGLAFLPGSEHAGLSLTFAGTGFMLVLTGTLALRSYLAKNPLQEGADD